MVFESVLPAPSFYSPESFRNTSVLSHLIRRNFISEMEDLIKDSKDNGNCDVLSQIRNQSEEKFKKTLISQIN